MNGNVYRSRSAKNIADEVEQLIESGIIFYRFDDDIFSLNQKLTIEFCEEIIKRGIHKKAKWACFGHVNVPHEKMYKLMAELAVQELIWSGVWLAEGFGWNEEKY